MRSRSYKSLIRNRITPILANLCLLMPLTLYADTLLEHDAKDFAAETTYATQSKSSSETIFFGRREINSKHGFVINKPGKYVLTENVNSQRPQNAIIVRASDVVIDLNGFTISGKDIAPTGIVVRDAKNVVIKNGALKNFTVNGIHINRSREVALQKILVLQNGSPTGPNYTGGLAIFNTSDVNIRNSNLNGNFHFGLGMSGVSNVNFIRNNVTNTRGFPDTSFFGNSAFGIYVSSEDATGPFSAPSTNLNISDSTIENTTGGDTAFGVFIASLELGPNPVEPNSNIVVNNCIINNTKQTNVIPTVGTLAPFLGGVTVRGAFGVNIKNCIVDTLTGVATTDSPTSHIVGIELTVSDQATIEGCSVSNVTAIANYVNGIDIEGSGNDITINNCQIYKVINNSVNPNHFAMGYGLVKPLNIPTVDAVGTGTIIQNSIAQRVLGPNGATAAGVLISNETDLVVEDSIFNNNSNGILVADLLSPTLVSSNNLIKRNIVDGNTLYGISDTTTANNAYYGNSARSNGSANYSGLPAGTPIVVWNIGSPPVPGNGSVLDNYSILP